LDSPIQIRLPIETKLKRRRSKNTNSVTASSVITSTSDRVNTVSSHNTLSSLGNKDTNNNSNTENACLSIEDYDFAELKGKYRVLQKIGEGIHTNLVWADIAKTNDYGCDNDFDFDFILVGVLF
jgi:hypothetical protein